MSKIYEIDGTAFSSLDEFSRYFSMVVLEGYEWNGNLNAFNDILRGGFGTPDAGFTLRWQNSKVSRVSLGYSETVRILEQSLQHCHPSNRSSMQDEIARAKENSGPTVFDWLVEIIRDHGEGGSESEDNVILELL